MILVSQLLLQTIIHLTSLHGNAMVDTLVAVVHILTQMCYFSALVVSTTRCYEVTKEVTH